MFEAQVDNQVGILALQVYFPNSFVHQQDLEREYGVSAGKYTIGLGQQEMAFTGDREDINSIALTVVHSLLEKYSISLDTIGRLEIGTESLIDKSKSTKTVLMSLFNEAGNNDVEGATVVNACYGGTAALLNALTWVDSSAWDGRYAIVVAADIAVYADGPARPTGGCGAVAMLVGRDAPLPINLRTRTTYATHVWDFFKPKMDSEYPEVNGALSQTCYLRALDDCYSRHVAKRSKLEAGATVGVDSVDHFLFHSPYNKLVQKSFSRIIFQDMLTGRLDGSQISNWASASLESTYEDKALESKLKELAAPYYIEKVDPSCQLSKQIGNTYTASLYMNLANLVSSQGSALDGKKVTLFSYGSGAVASMFEINPTSTTQHSQFSLERMQEVLDLTNRLGSRHRADPSQLDLALAAREKSHMYVPFHPSFEINDIVPGTYYLETITAGYERIYQRKPLPGGPTGLSSCGRQGSADSMDDMIGGLLENLTLEVSMPPATSLQRPTSSVSFNPPPAPTPTSTPAFASAGMSSISSKSLAKIKKSQTIVWASGRPNIKVVVTGVAAALPGREKAVYGPGSASSNVQRIIAGENFISPIPALVTREMIAKNVVELVKGKDGTQTRRPVETPEQQIHLCASLGEFSLTHYGVSESIASTMDRAVQVAVSAGLEALKDAGIVTGEGGLAGWVLPEHFQDTTGVVYATSFPALDTTIEEVSRYFTSKAVSENHIPVLMQKLRQKLEAGAGGALSEATEAALIALGEEAAQAEAAINAATGGPPKPYEFDRKFLFRVLVLGNAQLAQIIKAKGPNMQTNAACAGATQAIALAYDMIQVGRAERMVVIAGDNASSDTLMPWLGNGFRALGAATIASSVEMAALPFDQRRSGMILGSGGIGMILESEQGAMRRFVLQQEALAAAEAVGTLDVIPECLKRTLPFRCRMIGTLISNSAYHGAAMDRAHIAAEMERFVASIEEEQGISREEIAKYGVYFSHETCTHASPTSSCASNELFGLRKVFGEHLQHLLILNTKGFTGHPMGVSFEDVVAAEVLVSNIVPPIAHFSGESDPALGPDLKLSRGGEYPCKYALRFAAGFGSHIALALYGTADT